MKYGQTLRSVSVPEWQNQNIEYEHVKHFIKEHTTPGNGKAVSIPGAGDESAKNTEDDLFNILKEQNERITWFVKSKVGEIKRRLVHLDHQINKFASRRPVASKGEVSLKRLERYGHIETDIIKVGEEIKSLSRFIGVQQTAFRKLLKKYKKWTGNQELGDRFNKEIMQDEDNFTKTDLHPFVAQYEELLDSVRKLYNDHVSTSAKRPKTLDRSLSDQYQPVNSPFSHVQDIVERGKQVEFDHLMASLRIGQSGKNAVYWVHTDNLVELQVLLSQYTRASTAYRKTPLNGSTPSSPSRHDSFSSHQNYFDVIADNQDKYLVERNSQTLEANESRRGSSLQLAAVHARGVRDEEAAFIARRIPEHQQSAKLDRVIVKRKCIQSFLERDPSFSPQKAAMPSVNFADSEPNSAGSIQDMRHWINQQEDVHPIATIQSQRSRFYDIASNASAVLLATLDSSISIHYGVTLEHGVRGCSNFPYSVLQIRQEGPHQSTLIPVLDRSHLVERVRGFSLEYHAVWDVAQPQGVAPPSWLSLLEQDLKKMPDFEEPQAAIASSSSDFASQATTPQVLTSTSSDAGNTLDGSTGRKPVPLAKTTRTQRQHNRVQQPPQQKYWNEFDHPEDSDDDNAFVLYINPNEESWFDNAWSNIRSIFHKKEAGEHKSLLSHDQDLESGTASREDSEDSDNELGPRVRQAQPRAYGTINQQIDTMQLRSAEQKSALYIPRLALISLIASIIILTIGYILASTGRRGRKKIQQTDAGIIFAVASSLAFAGVGVVAMFTRRKGIGWLMWALGGAVVSAIAVLSGVLLAWAIV
ncbi:hypothetical protein MBLNU457_g0381t1 [Dothideomycetes sp. NU457]